MDKKTMDTLHGEIVGAAADREAMLGDFAPVLDAAFALEVVASGRRGEIAINRAIRDLCKKVAAARANGFVR